MKKFIAMLSAAAMLASLSACGASVDVNISSDAASDAVFRQVCDQAGVPVQRYSNRADLPGGSTLGNLSTAQFSVHSVDVGLPQLAMHAAYEVAAAADTAALARAM